MISVIHFYSFFVFFNDDFNIASNDGYFVNNELQIMQKGYHFLINFTVPLIDRRDLSFFLYKPRRHIGE